jgi:hypothetical protein
MAAIEAGPARQASLERVEEKSEAVFRPQPALNSRNRSRS